MKDKISLKDKLLLIAILLWISAATAWLGPQALTSPAPPSPPPAPRANAQLELENQIRLAKADLYEAASNYLLSLGFGDQWNSQPT